MSRIAKIAYWALPSLFCLWLYWNGVRAWFSTDDFAWLGVNLQIHDWNSFWRAIFVPSQQGTIRPLSERLFFIAFWHMFEWNAIYYRLAVFLTQAFNLVLLSWIVRKLSGSRVAGFAAPVLWIANAAAVVPLAWTSGYNEVLCASFLLGAFALLLRFEETGKWRYYWLQALVFVVGLGALELTIVYPAIAFCRSRRRSTLPLFGISAIYYFVHAWAAPPQTSGPYAMHFDAAIPATFGTYCRWVFVAPEWHAVTQLDSRLGAAAAILLGGSLLIFLARRRFLPAFFAAWFVITLAPLLPLRDHITDYYLFIPSIGPAVIGALALRTHWRIAAPLCALFLAVQIPVARAGAFWHYERSAAVRDVVLGVRQAERRHPGKTILLANISPELFDTAIRHKPFRLISNTDVFLAPAEKFRPPSPSFTLPEGPVARALDADRLEVYSATAPPLRNITSAYTRAAPASWASRYPNFVDAGNPWMAYTLGPSWYPVEGAYRWMPKAATLRMAGGNKLLIVGYCPKQMLRETVTIAVDGQTVRTATLVAEGEFRQDIDLPSGKPSIEIRMEASRTFLEEAGDRPLSLAFGTFEIH